MSGAEATSTIVLEAFALAELSPPSSFADTSSEAADANTFFKKAMRWTMEQDPWSFARKWEALPKTTVTPPVEPFTVEFRLPGDFVRFIQYDQKCTWQRNGDLIWSDADDLVLWYVYLPTDESKLPEVVQSTIAHRMAWLLSGKYAKSLNRKQDIQNSLREALLEAKRLDAPYQSVTRFDGRNTYHSNDWAERGRA